MRSDRFISTPPFFLDYILTVSYLIIKVKQQKTDKKEKAETPIKRRKHLAAKPKIVKIINRTKTIVKLNK